jgi:hypothetical protein
LLQNALAAVPLSEGESINLWELAVLHSLINALFKTDAIEELKPLVLRYREVAKAGSARQGCMSVGELNSLIFSAQLHEAPCICIPCCEPLQSAVPLHTCKADRVSHRTHHAQEKTLRTP